MTKKKKKKKKKIKKDYKQPTEVFINILFEEIFMFTLLIFKDSFLK